MLKNREPPRAPPPPSQTAFPRACNGIRWAVSTLRACMLADWPEELASHEMFEEISMVDRALMVQHNNNNTNLSMVMNRAKTMAGRELLMRGLVRSSGWPAGARREGVGWVGVGLARGCMLGVFCGGGAAS